MKSEIKKLRSYIQMILPCHPYKNLAFLFLGVMIFLVVVAIVLLFIDVSPIPYHYANTMDYMYLPIDQGYETHCSGYYFVEDEDYIYIYYDDEYPDIVNLNQISGVPVSIDEDVLEQLLSDFQVQFPKLNVQTVDDMLTYTTENALDASVSPLWNYSIWIIIIDLIFIPVILIFIILHFVQKHSQHRSLRTIVENNEQDLVKEQLLHPCHLYSHLKVALLDDYLVMNQPIVSIMPLKDITWIYIDKHILTQTVHIMVYDRHYRIHRLFKVSLLKPKIKKEIIAFFNALESLSDTMIVGYNEENKRQFQRMKQGLERGCNEISDFHSL